MRELFNRDAYDVAWNYFRVHADQRLDLFKTYITWIIALTAGYVGLLEIKAFSAAIVISGLGFLLGVVFKQLDKRSSALLKLAEQALSVEEKKLAKLTGDTSIELISLAEAPVAGHWTYRVSFNVLFGGTSLLFAAGVLYALKGYVG